MIEALRLVNGDTELEFWPSDDIIPQALDVSFPAVREVTEPRTDDDGERDDTQLHGGRGVSLDLALTNELIEPATLIDQVKAFLHPRSRPYLYATETGWDQERRIRLRVDQMSDPYAGYAASQTRMVQLQWKAPDGVWEAADETELAPISADVPTTVGFSFPVTFPLAMTATQATGAVAVNNPGGTPAHFVAKLYGPCTAPRLVNETTGEEITFTSALVLAAGEYVEIDTRDRSAYLLSMSSLSRLTYIDFTVTSWWRLEPGEQQVRYAPGVSAAGSVAVITYRPSWL